MNSYKIFTFILLFAIPFNYGFAFDCEREKDRLITLEHEYQSAQLPLCEKVKSNQVCRKTSDPDSQKSIYQAQLDYNKALAKVNILEGLIAVSSSVQNSHEAMKKVDLEDISNVKKSIHDFIKNFDRADLLSQSMNPSSKANFFWDGYSAVNSSYEDTYRHIVDKCKDEEFKSFCDELKKKENESSADKDEIYKTLHGFANADSKLSEPGQLEKEQIYKKYQSYLMYKSDASEDLVPLSKLKDKDSKMPSEMQKVYKLQELVKKYEKDQDKKVAKEIVTISNEIRSINMNFNMVSIGNPDVEKYLKNTFEKNITNISSAAGILTGEKNIKKNFATVKKSLDIEVESKERVLLTNAAPLKGLLPSSCDISTSDGLGKCLKEVCQNDYLKSSNCNPKENKDALMKKGLEQLFVNYKGLSEIQLLRDANEGMLVCMDDDHVKNMSEGLYKDKSLVEKKQICLDHNKNQIPSLLKEDSLKDAEDELQKARNVLDLINQGQNIKDILAKKFITIKMLRSNKCIDNKNHVNAGYINSFCSVPNMNSHTKEALNLGSDVDNILLKYESTQYNDFFDEKGIFRTNKEGITQYQKMVNDCKANKTLSSVCPFLLKEDIKKTDKENENINQSTLRRRYIANVPPPPKLNDDYDDGPSAATYAFGGLATGVVKNMGGLFGYFQTRKRHERQMQMWDNQINMHNYYWGPGATHHTNNITVNYDDWYANQNAFNPTTAKYFNPASSFMFPTAAPATFGSPNSPLYSPAFSNGLTTSGSNGYNLSM